MDAIFGASMMHGRVSSHAMYLRSEFIINYCIGISRVFGFLPHIEISLEIGTKDRTRQSRHNIMNL